MKKILIVEDEGIVAIDIRYSLESMGYKVIGIVSSGEDAIRKAKELLPDLILMDIMLHGKMDGIEAASRIRSIHDIPIIFLSAYTEKGILDRAKTTGPFGYLIKPFEDKDLATTIEMAIYKNEMEIKQRRAKEEAVRMNRLKSEFLTNISHELRTPLNSITGFPKIITDTLNKFPDFTRHDIETALKCSHIISTQAHKLLDLINDLLDLSAIEADRLKLEEGPILAHSLLLSVLKTSEQQAQEKKITLADNRLEQEDFPFTGDIRRLEQVLQNLVQNAIKFSEKGTVFLSARTIDERIIFQVRDQGVGMSEEESKLIFNRFHQLDHPGENLTKGIGVGLDLVARLLKLMDGKISVESEKGKGSTFTVEIPWKRPKTGDALGTSYPAIPMALKGKNILLVEDDANFRFLVQSLLKDNYFALAENGAEAMEILESTQDFDVILLDRLMPVMGGDEFMRRVAAKYPGFNIPILIISVAGLKNDVEATEGLARKLGLQLKYIVKPFSLENILPALAELWAGK